MPPSGNSELFRISKIAVLKWGFACTSTQTEMFPLFSIGISGFSVCEITTLRISAYSSYTKFAERRGDSPVSWFGVWESAWGYICSKLCNLTSK